MKLTSKTMSIVVLLTSVSTVCAQQPRLKGKVTFEDPKEQGSQIRINLKNVRTGKLVEGQQDSTKVPDWYHVAPIDVVVDVEFDGGGCYEGDGHPRISVKRENHDLPDVVLKKTRECRLKELRQAKGRTTTNAKANTGGVTKRSGGAASVEEETHATVGSSSDFYLFKSLESNLIPSPEEFRKELEAEAAHARNGEFFDTFQYKFNLKSALYQDRPELMKVLTDFKGDGKNSVFFKEIGKVRWDMFSDVVRRELQPSAPVNLDNVFDVVQEEAISPNIRGTANVALLNGTLPSEKLQAVRQFYRQQSPESPVFETSLVGLLRVGQNEDVVTVVRHMSDPSPETSRMAMEAVSLATLIKGKDAFPWASRTLADVAATSKDPWRRAFAYRSLRPFVDQGDETAFRAMEVGSEDNDPFVRVHVALALGAGETEKNKKASYLLRNILLTDDDRHVRDAARLSLSGASTKGWAADFKTWNSPKDQ